MTTGLAKHGLAEPGDAVLRPHAEQEYRAELDALAAADDRPRPPGWRLSPWAVTTYLLGGLGRSSVASAASSAWYACSACGRSTASPDSASTVIGLSLIHI